MEQRVSLITLGVADLELSRRFYERLGWKASSAGDGNVAFYQLPGMALALWSRAALAADAHIAEAGIADAGSGFGGVALAYNVREREEVATVLAEAEAAGGRILKPAGPAFWGGETGYFADPDGHLWEVAWNPQFALAPDGSLKLPA